MTIFNYKLKDGRNRTVTTTEERKTLIVYRCPQCGNVIAVQDSELREPIKEIRIKVEGKAMWIFNLSSFFAAWSFTCLECGRTTSFEYAIKDTLQSEGKEV